MPNLDVRLRESGIWCFFIPLRVHNFLISAFNLRTWKWVCKLWDNPANASFFPLVFLMFGLAGAGDTRPVGAGQDAAEQVEVVQDAAEQRAAEPHRFNFHDLSLATANFCTYTGHGAYGRVYLGNLGNQLIAVKKLDEYGDIGLPVTDEARMLCALDHANVAKVLGYCVSDGNKRFLVYEYGALQSLNDYLHEPLCSPPWKIRMKISIGAAEGLQYLHSHKPPIIFKDFNPSIILLNDAFVPRLCGFGIARPHLNIGTAPTEDDLVIKEYRAPEYSSAIQLTAKCDVYSFGVVLLELLTGGKALDDNRPLVDQSLLNWVRRCFTNRLQLPVELPDIRLRGRFSSSAFKECLHLALKCTESETNDRPEIDYVIRRLKELAGWSYDRELY
ncbi:Serine/threonine-protein kinase PBS1-like protein [Drosera capensis]